MLRAMFVILFAITITINNCEPSRNHRKNITRGPRSTTTINPQDIIPIYLNNSIDGVESRNFYYDFPYNATVRRPKPLGHSLFRYQGKVYNIVFPGTWTGLKTKITIKSNYGRVQNKPSVIKNPPGKHDARHVFNNPNNSLAIANLTLSNVPILGSVINIFPKYGYESLSMKVIPREEKQDWIFTENFKTNIFDMSTIDAREGFVPLDSEMQKKNITENIAITVVQHAIMGSLVKSVKQQTKLVNEYEIYLGEEIRDILEGYFGKFNIEGAGKAWRAFGSGWRANNYINFLGIDQRYTNESLFRYALVRMTITSRIGTSSPKSNNHDMTAYEHFLNILKPGDVASSTKFFNNIGTHYVAHYVTGNTIFQVLAYERFVYEIIKRHLMEKNWLNRTSGDDEGHRFHGVLTEETILKMLYYSVHRGRIMILNSNYKTVDNIRDQLVIPFGTKDSPSIFKLFGNAKLLEDVEDQLVFEPEELIGLKLKIIAAIFRKPDQRKWFVETLVNAIALWETRLPI